MQIYQNIFSGGSLLPGHTVYRKKTNRLFDKQTNRKTGHTDKQTEIKRKVCNTKHNNNSLTQGDKEVI